MEMLQSVCVEWTSREREKHVWEDMYAHSWDEIIGRIYLLKAHDAIENAYYEEALTAFEQALILLAKDDDEKRYHHRKQEYYYRALADKALTQCYLGRYDTVLVDIDKALVKLDDFYQSILKGNRAAILVLIGAFSQALTLLEQELHEHPDASNLYITLGTCLLHMERYDEALTAYKQAEAHYGYPDKSVLLAAQQHRQPDWNKL